eukprot:scaffold182166_cov35-Tisochrysis_lutea.AAC.2
MQNETCVGGLMLPQKPAASIAQTISIAADLNIGERAPARAQRARAAMRPVETLVACSTR